MATSANLEDNIAAVAHHLRADLDQLVLQGSQRPVLDRLRRRQRAQEIAEVVGERMKLEPHRIGGERSARQSRPLDRAFALLDPLLARPALVVERDHALGRAAHVRHDEADAGIKFSGMPFDLGDIPPRLGPGSGLIAEIGMEPAHMVRRSSDWAREQIAILLCRTWLAGSRIAYLIRSASRNSYTSGIAKAASARKAVPDAPCRAPCRGVAFGHAQGRSTGQTGRQEQRKFLGAASHCVSKRP